MKGLPGVQLQNESDNSSYWRDFSIYQKKDVLFQLKIRRTSEKFKKPLRPLLRQRSVNLRQHFRNLSHETVPLKILKKFDRNLPFLIPPSPEKRIYISLEASRRFPFLSFGLVLTAIRTYHCL
jgi:hypothetical protein